MNIFPTTVIVTFLFVLSISTSTSVSSSEHCETLKTKLSYKQENAPKDISAVVRDIDVSNLKKNMYIYIFFHMFLYHLKFISHEFTSYFTISHDLICFHFISWHV